MLGEGQSFWKSNSSLEQTLKYAQVSLSLLGETLLAAPSSYLYRMTKPCSLRLRGPERPSLCVPHDLVSW